MSTELEMSIAERARRVPFGRFTRQRPDDRAVELFLAWWQEGHFKADVKWLPQHINNVEAIARNSIGTTLAIEHTSIHAFPGHQSDERRLAAVAKSVESAAELRVQGRGFDVILPQELFEELNEKTRHQLTESLIHWLSLELKQLPRSSSEVRRTPALPPRKKDLEIVIQMHDVQVGSEFVHVTGMLPNDAKTRALPQVNEALARKLPKLIAAAASSRVLLIELPTIDTSQFQIIDLVQHSPQYALTLQSIDFVVVAKTFVDNGTGTGWFLAYDTKEYALSDVGHLTWDAPS